MQFRSMFALGVAVVAGTLQVDFSGEQSVLSAGSRRVYAAEQDPKPTKGLGNWQPSGDALGFTAKGQPYAAERTIPGLVGALLLTDEQKHKLQTAQAETVQSEAVRSAGLNAKLNPNATEAEKDDARRKATEAREQLRQRVATILTEEQRSLVVKLDGAVSDAQREVSESMQADFASAKGNEELRKQYQEQARKRVVDNFKSRLSTLMSAAQQAGFEKAAAVQAAADAAAANKPKGNK